MSALVQMIGDLLTSKKFIAMVAGIISVTILKVFKVNVDPQIIVAILGLVAVYIGAQGLADHKKEAAKIEAVAASSMSDSNTPKADQAVAALADEVKAG